MSVCLLSVILCASFCEKTNFQEEMKLCQLQGHQGETALDLSAESVSLNSYAVWMGPIFLGCQTKVTL